jgi:hypothetical protein
VFTGSGAETFGRCRAWSRRRVTNTMATATNMRTMASNSSQRARRNISPRITSLPPSNLWKRIHFLANQTKIFFASTCTAALFSPDFVSNQSIFLYYYQWFTDCTCHSMLECANNRNVSGHRVGPGSDLAKCRTGFRNLSMIETNRRFCRLCRFVPCTTG